MFPWLFTYKKDFYSLIMLSPHYISWSVVFILLSISSHISAICPDQCDCNLDDTGRRQVFCNTGSMVDPFPIRKINKESEVIIITAPEDSPNVLTIGPIFTDLKKLEELHIVRSNIPAIGMHSFWGIPTLRVLNLSQNNVTEIRDYNFRGLENLIELDLSENFIYSLPSGVFRYLLKLKKLSLARNKFTELGPRLFLKLGKLKELILDGNRLVELNPELFKDISELTVFRCRSCGLNNINNQMYTSMQNLLLLDLGDNELKFIASDEFVNLQRLNYLYLDGNQLTVILENSFASQTELNTLSLAHNTISKIATTALVNLIQLEVLDLSYNRITKLEAEIFQPVSKSLLYLNISGNNIGMNDFKYVLQQLPKIKELSMSEMNLSEIPLGLFMHQGNLEKLNLSGNSFIHFPVQIFTPTSSLSELDLSMNHFHGLEEKVLIRLETIPLVHLDKNPWSCNLCHMIPMINYLEKGGGNGHISTLRCFSPNTFHDREIGSLMKSELEWCNTGGIGFSDSVPSMSSDILGEDNRVGVIAAGAAVVLFVVTSIAFIVGICYSKRHEADYYTHEEKRGPEHENMFDTLDTGFGENGDIRFKFPMELNHGKNKLDISTIDEIKRDPQLLSNGS